MPRTSGSERRRDLGPLGRRQELRRTTADLTFGAGLKAPGGRVSSRVTRATERDEDRQRAVVPAARRRPRARRLPSAASGSRRAKPASASVRSTSRDRIGDEMLYGRLPATRVPGGRRERVQVEVEDIRPATTRSPAQLLGGRAAARSRSSSMATTAAARAASGRVMAPRPGPISRNVSSGEGSMAATSLRAQAGSRKCWPNRLRAFTCDPPLRFIRPDRPELVPPESSSASSISSSDRPK